MTDDQWPEDAEAFEHWWQQRTASLRVEPEVRDYMQAVLRGGRTPWYLRPALPLQRFATRGLLPPTVRQAYGLQWSARDERRWQRFRRLAPKLYWMAPTWLRHLPAKRVLADFRRRQGR